MLLLVGAARGQQERALFDGKTTSGWIVQGDAEVVDGVLVLGGKRKTNVRLADEFSSRFELRIEYRTENALPILVACHHRDWLGTGMHAANLSRTSKNPEEWLEVVYAGKERGDGSGWRVESKIRAAGEPAFGVQELGRSTSVPRSAFIAFEIPAGQQLYLRKVVGKFEPMSSIAWILIGGAAAVVFLSIVAWMFVRKRKASRQQPSAPGQR